jgi:hypothetical protein
MRMCVGVVLLLVACSSKKPSSTGGAGSSGSSVGSAATDPCSASALGLGSATELTTWSPSNGCDLPRPAVPTLLSDLKAIAEAIDCNATGGGGPPLVFDGPVVVTMQSFSPAQTAFKAFDDGTTITFVNVQRSPCPNDPRPMPGPSSPFGFGPLATGGSRTFADRACTVPARCP